MNYTFTSIDIDGVKSTREFEADCWFDSLICVSTVKLMHLNIVSTKQIVLSLPEMF